MVFLIWQPYKVYQTFLFLEKGNADSDYGLMMIMLFVVITIVYAITAGNYSLMVFSQECGLLFDVLLLLTTFCFVFPFSFLVFFCVLCPVLQCLWIVYSLLPHWITLTFISYLIHFRVRVMVFNATLNNISVISWQSALLVEETRVLRENHRPATSHWQTLSHYVVSSTPCHVRISSKSQR